MWRNPPPIPLLLQYVTLSSFCSICHPDYLAWGVHRSPLPSLRRLQILQKSWLPLGGSSKLSWFSLGGDSKWGWFLLGGGSKLWWTFHHCLHLFIVKLAEIAVSTLTFWANNPPLVRTFFRVVHGGGVHLHLVEVHVVIVNVVQPKVKTIVLVIVLLACEVWIPKLRQIYDM